MFKHKVWRVDHDDGTERYIGEFPSKDSARAAIIADRGGRGCHYRYDTLLASDGFLFLSGNIVCVGRTFFDLGFEVAITRETAR